MLSTSTINISVILLFIKGYVDCKADFEINAAVLLIFASLPIRCTAGLVFLVYFDIRKAYGATAYILRRPLGLL